MNHLLVPTDFSDNSWKALEYVIRLFQNKPCTFHILHIGDLSQSAINSNSFIFPSEKISPSLEEKLRSLFKRIKTLPINENHHFVSSQEYGNFIDIIRNTIAEKRIDLIVMGTKGASGIKAAIIGSNTGDVITKVACNVLVIPEKAQIKTPKETVFVTDYNHFYTYPILHTLTDFLQIATSNFHVLSVSNANIDLTVSQEKNKRYLREYLKELFTDTHRFHQIINKNTKAAVLHFVEDNQIDMLIMVAKNLNFFQQLLFDTTIEKLSFHTTVPLLVLHE